ncbi:non-heme iron oxygenase ferredoxin subunit [Saccharothrix sp.]|uniref:non-heme iron oxygenase ferredoxin subunit n=1 Tax=Saccharothrix sp. TaxID=1873460 RepID=UPI002811534B|nr:non-heme iron oxygenase ferredoxin subunit [Saccharothrix sp.]
MIRVCSLSDLDDRKPVAFEVGDEYTPVVLVRDGDTVHALHNLCSHAAIELSEGEVTRKGIECFLHGSCFDLRTGKPSSPPATEPVDVFAVDIRDGDVHVDVTVTLN